MIANKSAPAGLDVGVDVGGTFTDLIVVDKASGGVRIAKVLTTPDNQAFGVLAALDEAGVALERLQSLNHGTTTTTNALLERKIARCGLITTQGFRDVLELGRRTRPQPYGLLGSFEPLIPRQLRLEVPERLDAEGEIVVALDEDAVVAAMAELAAAGCQSLVVHFLHSYRNPVHELRVLELARTHWPNRYVTAGHRILSEFREYERGTTAAVNAAVQPVLAAYIERLQNELAEQGFGHELMVMQGNGGSVSASIVSEAAVHTVMSGPASGVMAAAATTRAAGIDRVITYDMGGTSSDVGLVLNGVPQVTAELDLMYATPIHVPMVDVHTIGAGGGSIARIDDAGMLVVGPESAGADPGPICYGRGGRTPTMTDANLVLGRLDPDELLAVDNPVSRDQVSDLLAQQIGLPLGLDGEQAAAAILSVGNNLMAGAIRMVSLSRGHDPRDFKLFAFGGAGPMHAAALARELGIPEVLLPARPGITNAIGCLSADVRHDYVNTLNVLLADLDIEAARGIIAEQIASGRQTIEREAVAVERIEFLHFADLQFQGQTHVLTVPVPGQELTVAGLRDAFAEAYWQRFMVELPEIRPLLVNVHTAAIGRRPGFDLAALATGERAATLAGAEIARWRTWFTEGWQETPVYARSRLPADAVITGPAIVRQSDCTSVIEPGDRARLDAIGNLIVRVATS
ncbi:MAG TPA: hydantoinase/oxoprolinase family protein [Alphaproteobacteria bacterium]|jgi:N-methylhydantoinase A|nr:hydantoinase/oxoprolinase family protein [Alphaproteobacteria bacterium]